MHKSNFYPGKSNYLTVKQIAIGIVTFGILGVMGFIFLSRVGDNTLEIGDKVSTAEGNCNCVVSESYGFEVNLICTDDENRTTQLTSVNPKILTKCGTKTY